MFTEIFLGHLPPRVQTALANTPVTEPRALAEEADRFFPGYTTARCRDVSRDAQQPICSQDSMAGAGHGSFEPAWRHQRVLLPRTFRDNG